MNLSGFVEEKVLGRGSYGSVYKGKRISDGQSYAVKVIQLGNLSHSEVEDSLNEIRLMASFQSKFLVRFHEAFCDRSRLCIVSEYARLGDFSHLIERRRRKGRPLKEDAVWRFLIQLLEGLRVLHESGVVHRDLKSANVLLTAPDHLKIADLGVSTVLRTTQLARTQIGTPMYLAPEIWKRRPYDQKCDMWSLGVLLYELMTFRYPFNGRTAQELAQKVTLGRYPALGKRYSPELVNIVRQLLQVNPLLRPKVSDLLQSQSIKKRINLVLFDMVEEAPNRLLDTIKIPRNIRNVEFPNPSYKKADIVKPIEERIHSKGPFNYRMNLCSSRELQLITDLDLWSPNKEGPLSQRPPRPPPPQKRNFQINPRLRRLGIR